MGDSASQIHDRIAVSVSEKLFPIRKISFVFACETRYPILCRD